MTYEIGYAFKKFDNDAHVWAREHDAKIVYNYEQLCYEIVADEISEQEKQERILRKMTLLIQGVLDKEAQKLGYDNCLSVCSYIDTGVTKFDDEGKSFRAWRSAVWAKGYEILDEVVSGKREIPTEEELLNELPTLTIAYSE